MNNSFMPGINNFNFPLPADSAVVAESNQMEIESLNKRLAGMESMLSQFIQGQKGMESDQRGREKIYLPCSEG